MTSGKMLGLRGPVMALAVAGLLCNPMPAMSQETPATPPTQAPTVAPTIDYWQPLWMERELWGAGKMSKGMQARVLRHWTFTQYGIPAEYRVAKSPLDRTPEAVRSGARLYARHCASCHGRTGLGDGQASRSLLPSPALLAYMVQRPIAVDSYLVWSISEGGVPFGTEMPAFKGQLTRNQIWEIIAFMRAGFSEHTASGKGGGAVNRP